MTVRIDVPRSLRTSALDLDSVLSVYSSWATSVGLEPLDDAGNQRRQGQGQESDIPSANIEPDLSQHFGDRDESGKIQGCVTSMGRGIITFHLDFACYL